MDTDFIQNHIELHAHMAWDILVKNNKGLQGFKPPRIILNNRLWRTAGWCYVNERCIHFGTKFFRHFHNRMISEILVHELCHQAVADIWGFNPVNGGHCNNWAYLMNRMGFEPKRFHDMVIDRMGNKC